MEEIKSILTLEIDNDIKNVIDLEDRNLDAIKSELDSYIVTNGIGEHLYTFMEKFNSQAKETGVWISGFYGSGKSYFGKMLGYLIKNPTIEGTSFVNRFIPKLAGINNQSIIENCISDLNNRNNRVILLDIAKQNTDNGLAFTLFLNFLKSLGFSDNKYGYIVYHLFVDGKYDEFKSKVKEVCNLNWDDIKGNIRELPRIIRAVIPSMGYDYNEISEDYSDEIRKFSASKLKDELERYFEKVTDETIVFIFDEASESISQKKFTLLDLEGLSESLSSFNNKVWTIAIAQEKLDDVIHNSNLNMSQLTKLTDRFRMKLHLESTEVDLIIKNRLLNKKPDAYKKLIDFYNNKSGVVNDMTNLNASIETKTKNAESFATYYPFHEYQFKLLQKFLFSSNTLSTTQIAARGMISTTFDVLRKHLANRTLFDFATGYDICSQAQQSPPTSLGLKYNEAKNMLISNNIDIDGEKLLKVIHFLSESKTAPVTVENITKSYLTDISKYYELKSVVEDALKIFEENKVVIRTNNDYKITSDEETKLLDDMENFTVEHHIKKRKLTLSLKESGIFKTIQNINVLGQAFQFGVYADNEEEICSSNNKNLKVIVYSLYNVLNKAQLIDECKTNTQDDKNIITIIPDISEFEDIDNLFAKIQKYEYIEEKHANESDKDVRAIINDFKQQKEEKINELKRKVEKAYLNSTLIYMFDEQPLTDDKFKNIIGEYENKAIKNLYTKQLPSQLSTKTIHQLFTTPNERVAKLFDAECFRFFDSEGIFIGENLLATEGITSLISGHFVDGKTLLEKLDVQPYGWKYETISTILAVLMRAGRLFVKSGGETYNSYKGDDIEPIFTNSRMFNNASFKYNKNTLSSINKQKAIEILQDLDCNACVSEPKINYNTVDFEIAVMIKDLSNYYINKITTLKESNDAVERMCKNIDSKESILQDYTSNPTENNYIEKIESFIDKAESYTNCINSIRKLEKFVKNNLEKIKTSNSFVKSIKEEVTKSEKLNPDIEEKFESYNELYNGDVIANYQSLLTITNNIKDEYYKISKKAMDNMGNLYKELRSDVEKAIEDLNTNYPIDLNQDNLNKLTKLKDKCNKYILSDLYFEKSICCEKSGLSLFNMINLSNGIFAERNTLLEIQSKFIKEKPMQENDAPIDTSTPIVRKVYIPKRKIKINEYKQFLMSQLQALNTFNVDDEIEISMEEN